MKVLNYFKRPKTTTHIRSMQSAEMLDVVKKNNKALSVSLEKCNINNVKIAEGFIRALEQNLKLEILNLSNNPFDYNMTGTIADFIRGNPKLKSLILNHCPMIGDNEARLIAGALRDNKRLRFIDLSNCNIGDEGAKHILSALIYENKTVSNIKLIGNPMSPESHSAISRQIKANIVINSANKNAKTSTIITGALTSTSLAAGAYIVTFSGLAAITFLGGVFAAYYFYSQEKDTGELAKQ